MNNSPVIVVADGHVHIYPAFDGSAAVQQLIRNLGRLADAAGVAGRAILKLALLTESRDSDFFRRLQERDRAVLGAGLDVANGTEDESLTVIVREVGQVCLVAGRQIVTHERLEILGLAMRATIPDGLPAAEVIRRVVAAGGIPVLAWSPGKWWFQRGRLARDLIASDQAGILRLGDTTLRPTLYPEPQLMKLARRRGIAVVPGSDPLPLAGEERYLGTYGFIYRGPFDAERPAAAMIRLLAEQPAAIITVGARCGAWAVARRLYSLRKCRRT